MQTSTKTVRWLMAFVIAVGFVGTASAQRMVTLVLNMASAPDTTLTTDFIEVRGAAQHPDSSGFNAPYVINSLGDIIDWSSASTIEPVNIGGDYWAVTGPVDNTYRIQFKFYSQQDQDVLGAGWEADPNPILEPGTNDTTLTVHFFESQREYRGVSGDRGPYGWRPYREPMGDSVAVWFRVYANTEGAAGYRRDATDELYVAGDPLGGESQLEWGHTSGVRLTREGSDRTRPAYDLWSGVAYYPASAIGKTQAYKFITWDGASTGWEDGISDRTFKVPEQDTTLRWVYFANTAPISEQKVTANVIFSVDLDPLEAIGVFSGARGDSLQVRGDFNGWGCSDPPRCQLEKFPNTLIYESVIPLNSLPQASMSYKYFIDYYDIPATQAEFGVDVIPSGWEEPYSTAGGNRHFILEGDPDNFQLVEHTFNDIPADNIMNDGESVDVTFRVNMTPALSSAQPFVPAEDTVIVSFGEPFWSMTQGLPLTPRGTEGDDRYLGDALNKTKYAREIFHLTDADEDMIYEGTFTVSGPTYAAFQYQFSYGNGGTWVDEPGGGTEGTGRRRQRFIWMNPDGSWPATFTVVNDRATGDMGPEQFQDSGNLPGDDNPALSVAVEPTSELPSQVTLGRNYPNPFNPSTTFEYAIDRTMDVRVRVYDVLGRVVATLVDGVQQAATYRVTFDASHLASGIYLYRLETPNRVLTNQMILVK